MIRTIRRFTADSRSAPQPGVRSHPDCAELDAGGNGLALDREEIESRIFNLVLFLRERPCGSHGLGSVDRCGLPHRASRCGVHAALEQVGADVASILDQLDQLRSSLDAVGNVPGLAPVSLEATGTGDELWDTADWRGEEVLVGESVISEALKLTQKIQLRGGP